MAATGRDGKWAGRVAIVTGASSGIGAATARRLAAAGLRVALVARRLERLLDLKSEIESGGGQAEAFAADLACEEERRRLFDRIDTLVGPAEALVNNAGFGWYGYYEEMPWETARDMLQVNVGAAIHLTSLFLPGMRARNSGHVVNIGSIAGSFPNQGVAVYSATKSFLDAFTTVLYRELRGSKVNVSVVRAGPVRTEFCEQALNREGGGHVPTENVGVTSEVVAEKVWRLLLRPRKVVYVPSILRLAPWVEMTFGWLVDRLGPLLLKYRRTA
ncbi:MAG: SDR family NAD(P)-dependent oxidoreductase [Chloroflexi bacterium]|nr:SDR family NAD(P)-dependent oxidoreductase [Chloroflexota bacterium]